MVNSKNEGCVLVTLERLARIFHIFIQKEEASLSSFQVIVTAKESTQSYCHSHPGSYDSENWERGKRVLIV